MFTNKQKVCYVSTIAWPLRVYMGAYIRKIAESKQVLLVGDGVSEFANGQFNPSVRFQQVAIARRVSLIADFLALIKLWRIFRNERFDCVHSIMPKAGLLTMIASWAAGVPVRFHTFTGQAWATQTGIQRRFLMFLDWLVATLATSILTDSFSQRDFLIANKIIKADKITVLGFGSIAGVNTHRFSPDSEAREKGRIEIGIGIDDFVLLFVGRLNHDKGVLDLLSAFSRITGDHPNMHLLIVGPDEDGYDLRIANMTDTLRQRIHRVGFTVQPERYMAMSDVICLPSYREGFGSVLIEGAACGLPAIASRIYGIRDAVVDNVTGILHEPGNVSEIALSMLKFAEDEHLRKEMGFAARLRASRDFSEELLTSEFLEFYRNKGV